MGRYQRAEAGGLVSALLCSLISLAGYNFYIQNTPAIWQLTARRLLIAAAIVAVCSLFSFSIAFGRHSQSLQQKVYWVLRVRRLIELVALSVLYAVTVLMVLYALFTAINLMVPSMTASYMQWIVTAAGAFTGYTTFIQGELITAKTLASLLPLFVITGVTTAGLSSDDQWWWKNNFSQLGDNTTFAARIFNMTLVLAGVSIVIISYFCVSELVATHRLRRREGQEDPQHYHARIMLLVALLITAGIMFAGVGIFRYTPHPIIHNLCARGLVLPMTLLMLLLPWLAPQMSKIVYIVSDLILLILIISGVEWYTFNNLTLTVVEALAGILFMAWFIVFTRQIAAMEADRLEAEIELDLKEEPELESRLSPGV